jgi:2-methylisocitrate lyase-like PEP mutase family enzyme
MIEKGLSKISHAQRRALLHERLSKGRLIVAPGVFEMVSAKIADRMGFDALYMTGYGTVASYLGLPDAGLATYTDMVNRVSQFASITHTPMICDGDTGYGGLLNVMHTVRGYEAAGACAIQLEDQEFPKKCGHMLGRRVIPMQDMVEKIRVAVETRDDPNFQIIARTDARTTLGLDEALRRAESYARAGADVLFVESPESVEAMIPELSRRAEISGLGLVVHDGHLQLVTSPKVYDAIETLRKEETTKDLSKAALETLSIILYQDNVSRADIDFVRGVNSSFIIRNLLVRGLIIRKPHPSDSRTFVYTASHDLLSYLGISSISDLPDFERIQKILQEKVQDLQSEEESE